jgi:exosortase/archaeosortase family protein
LLVGTVVSAFSYGFLWFNFRHFLLDSVAQVLSFGQISVAKSFASEAPQLVIRLLDGSDLTLALTWQRSGLGSIAIFTMLFLFLLFPLEGSIRRKIVWLGVGFILGVIWSFLRLSIAVFIAYYLGAGAFTVAEFFTNPFTDFLWMVSVWSLALSAMISAKIKRVS